MEVQIENIKAEFLFQSLHPGFEHPVVLPEAVKYKHGHGALAGLGVMKATGLVVDEILLDEHDCKDGETCL